MDRLEQKQPSRDPSREREPKCTTAPVGSGVLPWVVKIAAAVAREGRGRGQETKRGLPPRRRLPTRSARGLVAGYAVSLIGRSKAVACRGVGPPPSASGIVIGSAVGIVGRLDDEARRRIVASDVHCAGHGPPPASSRVQPSASLVATDDEADGGSRLPASSVPASLGHGKPPPRALVYTTDHVPQDPPPLPATILPPAAFWLRPRLLPGPRSALRFRGRIPSVEHHGNSPRFPKSKTRRREISAIPNFENSPSAPPDPPAPLSLLTL